MDICGLSGILAAHATTVQVGSRGLQPGQRPVLWNEPRPKLRGRSKIGGAREIGPPHGVRP